MMHSKMNVDEDEKWWSKKGTGGGIHQQDRLYHGAVNWHETILVPGQLPNFRIYLCSSETSNCHQYGMNERGSATIRYDTGGYQIIFGCRTLMLEWGTSLEGSEGFGRIKVDMGHLMFESLKGTRRLSRGQGNVISTTRIRINQTNVRNNLADEKYGIPPPFFCFHLELKLTLRKRLRDVEIESPAPSKEGLGRSNCASFRTSKLETSNGQATIRSK